MKAEQLLQHFERISEAPEAIPRLRRFILDLAVRGKLVEQDPSDEPAEAELIEARRRLELAAQTTKRLRWKRSGQIDKSAIAKEVPSGWTPARVNDTGLYINGLAFKPSDWKQSGLPIIRIQNLTDPAREFNYAQGQYPDEVIVQNGDLLVSWSATLEAFKWERGQGVLNQHIFRVVSDDKLASRDFLLLLLRNAIREMADGEHAHGLVMTHINRGPFLDHVVLIPPLAEQHRIVARVDELMSLCDQLEAAKAEREQCRDSLVAASLQGLNQPAEEEETFREHARFTFTNLPRITTRAAHIKQLRQTILNLAVRGKLVPQDPSDEPAAELLKRISAEKARLNRKERSKRELKSLSSDDEPIQLPIGWALAPLADLVTVLNGRAYKQQELLSAGTPVLRVGNLFTSDKWYYSTLELDEDKYCEKGDLIFAWSASFGPFIWGGDKVIYHYHIWKLPLHSEANLSKLYLYNFLLQKTREIKEAGHGISMIHMTKEKMERLQVPLPPLAEQHRIVAKVDELMAICDQLEAQLTASEQDSRRFLEAVLKEALSPALATAD